LYAQEKVKQSSTEAIAPDLDRGVQGIQWFELMAYVGGMWFILSKLTAMGSKLMNTNYKTLNFEIENIEQTRP